MRLIRAVRELNAEHGTASTDVALHTEAERARDCSCAQADEAVVLRETGTRRSPYLDHAELERALRAGRADAVWVGWGFVAEDPAFAELCARLGITFIGPSPRRCGCSATRSRPSCSPSRPACRSRRGAAARSTTSPRRRRHAERDRLPADHQGPQRRRRPRHPDRAGTRTSSEALERHPGRGAAQRSATRSSSWSGWSGRPAHRGAGHRRRARHGLGARRARLLDPAPQPEGDRGVRLAGADRRSRTPSCARPPIDLVAAAGYRGAGTVEFLYQPEEQAVRLPGGEHPAAGRAPGHRGDHRARPGQAADPRGRPAGGWRASARRSSGTPSRPGSTPRTPTQGFAPAPGTVELLQPADRARRPGRHRHRRRRRHPAGLRLDGRQGHRLGPGPRRGAGPAASRPARDHRRAATAAPPPSRSCSTCSTGPRSSRARPTPAGWTASAPADAGSDAHADVALLAVGHRRLRRRGGARARAPSWPRPAAAGRAPPTPSAARVELGYRGQSYSLPSRQVGPHRYRVEIERPATSRSTVDRLGQSRAG